jgi:hypothetical protein
VTKEGVHGEEESLEEREGETRENEWRGHLGVGRRKQGGERAVRDLNERGKDLGRVIM